MSCVWCEMTCVWWDKFCDVCVCVRWVVCDVMYEMRCVYDKFGDVCVCEMSCVWDKYEISFVMCVCEMSVVWDELCVRWVVCDVGWVVYDVTWLVYDEISFVMCVWESAAADGGGRRRTTAGGMQARKQKPHSDVGNYAMACICLGNIGRWFCKYCLVFLDMMKHDFKIDHHPITNLGSREVVDGKVGSGWNQVCCASLKHGDSGSSACIVVHNFGISDFSSWTRIAQKWTLIPSYITSRRRFQSHQFLFSLSNSLRLRPSPCEQPCTFFEADGRDVVVSQPLKAYSWKVGVCSWPTGSCDLPVVCECFFTLKSMLQILQVLDMSLNWLHFEVVDRHQKTMLSHFRPKHIKQGWLKRSHWQSQKKSTAPPGWGFLSADHAEGQEKQGLDVHTGAFQKTFSIFFWCQKDGSMRIGGTAGGLRLGWILQVLWSGGYQKRHPSGG